LQRFEESYDSAGEVAVAQEPEEARDAPAETIALARVTFDYEAEEPGELTLVPDDIIYVFEKDASGWWKGMVNGTVGSFPFNFTEEIPFTPRPAPAPAPKPEPPSVSFSLSPDTSPEEDDTQDDENHSSNTLGIVESDRPRLVTVKRTMGAASRRAPSRAKRALKPSASLDVLPLSSFDAKESNTKSSSPQKTASPLSSLCRGGSMPNMLASRTDSVSSLLSSGAGLDKWPSQQLGSFQEFCSNSWALLEQQVSSSAEQANLGIAICTTGGAVFSLGNRQPFALGQCAFPFLQAIATNQFDAYTITTHIGSERAPSGAVMSLNADKKPHNGQTVAGALKLASLLYQDLDAPSRIAEILQLFATFAGVPYLSCSVPAYLKFRSSSSIDYAVAYWLKSCGGLEGDVVRTLDLFFQICAVESSCETLAAMAAALANSGSCPVTQKRAVKKRAAEDVVKHLTLCCGPTDVDMPAVGMVASTSGCTLLVVPGVMGLAAFAPAGSPALDKFCTQFLSRLSSLQP